MAKKTKPTKSKRKPGTVHVTVYPNGEMRAGKAIADAMTGHAKELKQQLHDRDVAVAESALRDMLAVAYGFRRVQLEIEPGSLCRGDEPAITITVETNGESRTFRSEMAKQGKTLKFFDFSDNPQDPTKAWIATVAGKIADMKK